MTRAPICHAPRAQRERDGHHRGEPLGNRGDCQAHRSEKHLVSGFAAGDACHEHERDDRDRNGGHAPSENREAPLQRRAGIAVGFEQPGDPADLGGHPGRHHHPMRPAIRDRGALECHVLPVRDERRTRVRQRIGHFRGRFRLAGQRGLVHAQAVYVDETEVSRYDVTARQLDDVTGNQLGAGHLADSSRPQYPARGRRELAQGGHRFGGPVLLREAEERVQQQDHRDSDGVDVLADQQCHQRGDAEHHGHRVRELACEQRPRRRGLARRERIHTELLQPPACLLAVESAPGVGRQELSHRRCFHRPRMRRQPHVGGHQRTDHIATSIPAYPTRSSTASGSKRPMRVSSGCISRRVRLVPTNASSHVDA